MRSLRRRRGRPAVIRPAPGPGEQRRDGQAELVDQVGRGQRAEQVRAALAEQLRQPASAQRGRAPAAQVDRVAAHPHQVDDVGERPAAPTAVRVVSTTGRTGASAKAACAGSRSSDPETTTSVGYSASPCARRQARRGARRAAAPGSPRARRVPAPTNSASQSIRSRPKTRLSGGPGQPGGVAVQA